MHRRQLLKLGTLGTGFLAGCAAVKPLEDSADSPSAEPSAEIVVDPSAADSVELGSDKTRVGSIQRALELAHPGDTIHVKPGEYHESIRTVRLGTAAEPITITGSATAVIRGDPESYFVFRIRHSHIQFRGLTIDGLRNPDRPEDPASYMQTLIHSLPPFTTDEYLEDIVIAPARIGNAGRPFMVFNRTKNLEIGPTKVIGLAGAEYNLGDIRNHVGEIVYLGKPPGTALGVEPKPDYPWRSLDETRHVHIHHIDNSAGHPHSELVNTKLGTRDVLIEYCTDGGGSQNSEPRPSASIRFQSYGATVRWSDLRNGHGYGVHVQAGSKGILAEVDEPAVSQDTIGTGHSIHGNRIRGFDDGPIRFDATTPDEQKILCGNEFPESTAGSPSEPCPGNVPNGDGTGHIGGNSPWS